MNTVSASAQKTERRPYTGALGNKTWDEWLEMRERAGDSVEMILGLLHYGLPPFELGRVNQFGREQETAGEVSARHNDYRRRVAYYLDLASTRLEHHDDEQAAIAKKAYSMLLNNFIRKVVKSGASIDPSTAFFLTRDPKFFTRIVGWFATFGWFSGGFAGYFGIYSSNTGERSRVDTQEEALIESFFCLLFEITVVWAIIGDKENRSDARLALASEHYSTMLQTLIRKYPHRVASWPILCTDKKYLDCFARYLEDLGLLERQGEFLVRNRKFRGCFQRGNQLVPQTPEMGVDSVDAYLMLEALAGNVRVVNRGDLS